MKSFKKIWVGLLAVILLTLVFLGLSPHKALALGSSDLASPPASYEFLATNTIQGVFGGQTIQFQDGKSDSHYSFAPISGSFCHPNGPDGKPIADNDYGIKFGSDPSKAGSTIQGVITLGVISGAGCTEIGPSDITVSTAGVASAGYEYSNTNIITLNGNTIYQPLTSGLIDQSLTNRVYMLNTAAGSCSNPAGSQDDGKVIVLSSAGASTGTLYQMTSENRSNGQSYLGPGGKAIDVTTEWPVLAGIFPANNCWVLGSSSIVGPESITIAGSVNQNAVVTPNLY